MRAMLITLLLAVPLSAAAQGQTEKRVSTLEKRVTKVEDRVTRLESGPAPRGAGPQEKAPAKMPERPIGVTFLKKTQVIGEKRAGIRIYLRFENLSNRPFYAFNGTLVFRDENGRQIWTKPFGHSEPLGSGETVEVSVGLLSSQAKPYLAFIKSKSIAVTLDKQEVYGRD